jgi:hypothetical protein
MESFGLSGRFSPEIGPCDADSQEIAKELIMNLVNQIVEGKVIRVYLQEENPQAIEFGGELSEYQLGKEVGKVWCSSDIDVGEIC